MAITSGAGDHIAFLNVNGAQFPVDSGSVEQQAARKSSSFSATIPMSLPGAMATLAKIGDNTATITVFTRGMTGTLITGEIDHVKFDMIARKIHVTGRDVSAKLHDNLSSEKFQNKKGSDIVSDLCGRCGLSANVDGSTLNAGKLLQQDYVKISDNVSFAYIIHKLAEFDGCRWFVDGNGSLHYLQSGNPQGVYTINYQQPSPFVISDALHLSVSRNVQAGKPISVQVSSWHAKDKQVNKSNVTVGGIGSVKNYKYVIPNLKEDHTKQHAKSRAAEAARHEYTVHATVVGDPNCNAGMALQLNGTGFFDQQYDIDCVSHAFGMRGHTTTITARSAGQGRSAS